MIGKSDIANINKLLLEMNFGFGPPQGGGIQGVPVLVVQAPGAGVEASTEEGAFEGEGEDEFGDQFGGDDECHCIKCAKQAITDLQAVLAELEAGNKGPEQAEKLKSIAEMVTDGSECSELGGGDADPFSGLNSSDSDDSDDSDQFGGGDDSEEDDDSEDEEQGGGFPQQKQQQSSQQKKPAPFQR